MNSSSRLLSGIQKGRTDMIYAFDNSPSTSSPVSGPPRLSIRTPTLGESSSSEKDTGASIGTVVAAGRDVRKGPRDRSTEDAGKLAVILTSSRKEKDDMTSMVVFVV